MTVLRWLSGWLLLVACVPLAWASPAPHADCTALTRVALRQARVISASTVATGTFVPPRTKPGARVPAMFRNAPAFCRVRVLATPAPASHIVLEVWLPLHGWNGRFRGQGNGGFAGYVNYAGLATAVGQGYASASTDTGHVGGDAAWALHHPQRVVDFGYRAIHRMTVAAKVIVKAFYGHPASHAYFADCSNGGRQALMEAQRFPADYDGIIAGAPVYDWTHLLTNALGIVQQADSAAGYIPPDKLPLITQAALKACDANDGLVDGVVGDPLRCHFDPSVLRCAKGQSRECLSDAQIATLKTIYGGARDASGKRLYYGSMPGAEDAKGGWNAWIFGTRPGTNALTFFVGNYFVNMVYDSWHWDYRTANLDAVLAAATRTTAKAMDAVDADLRPFVDRGGKLILYHGWNDPAISPLGTIAYFTRVEKALGRARTRQSVRLYMVPGMLHCDGGPGAHAFGQNATDPRGTPRDDIFAALVAWVERRHAPDELVASKQAVTAGKRQIAVTRKLCPYPQVARYRGHGDVDKAASFACVVPSGSGTTP